MSESFQRVLVIDKPPGVTAFDVLKQIKKMLGVKKAGHTGILDAFAQGVLPVFFGQATKLIPFIKNKKRIYEARILLGVETDTLDSNGSVVARSEVPDLNIRILEETLGLFLGESLQMPPQFCAKKIHGERASDLVRKGLSVELEPVKVTIHQIEVLNMDLPYLTIRVYCEGGTYIRSLARDLSHKLGTKAMLQDLTRIQCGPFTLSHAIRPEEIQLQGDRVLEERSWRIEEFARTLFPSVGITRGGAKKFLQGERVAFEDVQVGELNGRKIERGESVCVFEVSENIRLIGIGQSIVPLERNVRLWQGLGVIQPCRVILG
jgi:tRNA pseudouridine55 synthase